MRRYGFVGIIIRNRVAVIALIIYATSEELGAMAGQLGRLPGVVVKSALEPMGEGQQ